MIADPEFATVLERHRPELHRHCARMLRCDADAEDAVQDALLRAWRSRRTLGSSGASRAWLYRIATNACLDVLARRSPVLEEEEPPGPVDERHPEAVVLARETLELALLTAVQQLPPRQRASVILRDVLDYSARDTAAVLALSVPAANSALQRGREGLRERLAGGRLEWACEPPSAQERRFLDALPEAA